MSEPTFEELKSQIRKALKNYDDTNPVAAMLSGMSLVATFLAKCDGSKTMTAATVMRAIGEIGKERGMQIGKL